MNLACSGVLDECKDLRVVVMESGWTWLPAWWWRMDQEWRAFQREVPWMRSPPSTYVRERFRFVTNPVDAPEQGTELDDVLEQIGGAQLLVYGSDYPHRYGGDATTILASRLTPDELERVLWRNADELYQLGTSFAVTPA
jgi:predicted TIM-barrel fold metal-dependent hydrolase